MSVTSAQRDTSRGAPPGAVHRDAVTMYNGYKQLVTRVSNARMRT